MKVMDFCSFVTGGGTFFECKKRLIISIQLNFSLYIVNFVMNTMDWMYPKATTFRLVGYYRECSLVEFAWRMSFIVKMKLCRHNLHHSIK